MKKSSNNKKNEGVDVFELAIVFIMGVMVCGLFISLGSSIGQTQERWACAKTTDSCCERNNCLTERFNITLSDMEIIECHLESAFNTRENEEKEMTLTNVVSGCEVK